MGSKAACPKCMCGGDLVAFVLLFVHGEYKFISFSIQISVTLQCYIGFYCCFFFLNVGDFLVVLENVGFIYLLLILGNVGVVYWLFCKT